MVCQVVVWGVRPLVVVDGVPGGGVGCEAPLWWMVCGVLGWGVGPLAVGGGRVGGGGWESRVSQRQNRP